MNGLTTILNNEGYYIDDCVPRELARLTDELYDLVVLGDKNENFKIPDCLFENFIFYSFDNDLIFLDNVDKENSIVLIDDKKFYGLFENFKFKNIYDSKTYFQKISNLPKLDMTDYIFAFGFDEVEFIDFCKKHDSKGFIENRNVYNINNPLSLSFLIDRNMPQNILDTYEEIIDKQVMEGKYSITKEGKAMGVIYQGKDQDMAIDSELPLLYI
jgi:hypothetical protein